MPFTEYLNNIPALFLQDKEQTCFAGVTTELVPHIPAGSPELKCVIHQKVPKYNNRDIFEQFSSYRAQKKN